MQRLNGKNKAQFFSLDFVVGVILFITILISSIYIWDYSKEKIYLSEKSNNLNLIARNTMNLLVETSGNPTDWSTIAENDFNESNILSLGLLRSASLNDNDQIIMSRSGALGDNNFVILDRNKIIKMRDYNDTKYDSMKKMMGLLGPNYQFELKIKTWNGTAYDTDYNIGVSPPNASNIIKLDRMALLDGEYAMVSVEVWEE